MSIRRKIILLLLLVAAVAGLKVTVHTRTVDACVLCRSERVDHNVFGYAWQSFRTNTVTDWYRERRGQHAHQWGRASCTRSRNAVGMTTKWACGSHHPVAELPVDVQLRFLENADESQAFSFFDAMTSGDEERQQSTIERVWEFAFPAQN